MINSELTKQFKNQQLIEQNRQFQLSLRNELENDPTMRDLVKTFDLIKFN